MSNDIVSQLSVADMHVVQMENVSSSLDLPVSGMQMRMVNHLPSNPESHHFSESRDQIGMVEPMSGSLNLKTLTVPNNGVEHTEFSGDGMGSSALSGGNGAISNMEEENTSLPVKRKAEEGSISPSKRRTNSGPQRKTGPAHSNPSLNKKMVRNDPTPGKSGLQRGQPTNKQTTPTGSEAVRSKMRESLSAALALAFQKSDNNASNAEKDETDPSESNSTMGGHVTGSEEAFPSKELAGDGGPHSFQEFQYSSILPEEDVSFSDNFLVKDDLLQGNGLSWAFDFDMQMRDEEEAQNDEKPQDVVLTPENLASEIEDELFKLHGGANKKYKEKGRSLLFNLKDRNNPELRERVMSGEISPERLCSMSAEELASKELSEWRMAKAEEMAQMVVLPDTQVDMRRLVKKTHKGEYQVIEFDRGDESILAEVSGGTSVLTQPPPQKEIESPKDKENVWGHENISENQDLSGSLVIPANGTDIMQGMMVDELKDTEFLPPIVSLDEFMASLNSEPPFQNLSADEGSPKAGKDASGQTLESPKDASSSKKADFAKKRKVDTNVKSRLSPADGKASPSIASKVDYIWEGVLQLSSSSSVSVGGLFLSGEKTSTKEWPTALEIKGRVRLNAFEKFLQELPNSRTRAVMVLQFTLKEKSSENERSNLSEAIDSYSLDERLGYAEPAPGAELYLCPQIPKITEILNKNMMQKKSPETNNPIIENNNKEELIGVIVWKRAHMSNIISPKDHKHTSKKQQPFSTPTHNRAQDSSNVIKVNNTPTRTPPPTKPEPQPEEDDDIPPGFGPGVAAKNDDDDLPEFNFSSNISTPPVPRIAPQNMSSHGGVGIMMSPVDQVRELIQKYGQSGNNNSVTRVDNRLGPGIGVEPWDEDDDDMPEWQPQPHHQLHHQSYPVVNHGHRPPLGPPPPPINQQPMSPAGGFAHLHPRGGGRWVQPRGPLRGPRWRQH